MAKRLDNVKIFHDLRSKETWDALDLVIPKGYLCVEESEGKCRIKFGDGVNKYPQLPYIGSEIDISEVDSEIEKYLADYYDKDTIDQKFTDLGTIFRIKGRKDTKEELFAITGTSGDVWFVGKPTDDQMEEYYWSTDLNRWDPLGYKVTVDLDNYYTKAEVDGIVDPIATDVANMKDHVIFDDDLLILNCGLTSAT